MPVSRPIPPGYARLKCAEANDLAGLAAHLTGDALAIVTGKLWEAQDG